MAGARAAVALAGVLVLATGCGTMLPGSTLEKGVAAQVARTAGSRPSHVSCPDLKAEKGAQVTCDMTLDRQRYVVTVTVRSVHGDTVHYAIDPRPRP